MSRMFHHPVSGTQASDSVKRASVSPGAVVGGVGGVHAGGRKGGGPGTAIAGGVLGTLVGDAVYRTLANVILGSEDKEVRKVAVPVALLASVIAGQVSGSVTKNWLLGNDKKEKPHA